MFKLFLRFHHVLILITNQERSMIYFHYYKGVVLYAITTLNDEPRSLGDVDFFR